MYELRTIILCGNRKTRGMPINDEAIRIWLIKNLREKGRGARTELAAFLGLPSQAISRMTSRRPDVETRRISAAELLRMAEFFGTAPPMTGFEEETSLYQARHVIPIMGYVGAGAEIEPEFEQVPPDGLEQVEVPFPVQDGLIGFQVRGDSQLPKYEDGEILVVEAEQPVATDRLIGEMAVVRTYDGKRLVKRIMPGPKPYTYNLESHNAKTIIGARIAWASPIRMTIPNIGLRRVPHPKRAKPHAGAAAAQRGRR